MGCGNSRAISTVNDTGLPQNSPPKPTNEPNNDGEQLSGKNLSNNQIEEEAEQSVAAEGI